MLSNAPKNEEVMVAMLKLYDSQKTAPEYFQHTFELIQSYTIVSKNNSAKLNQARLVLVALDLNKTTFMSEGLQ